MKSLQLDNEEMMLLANLLTDGDIPKRQAVVLARIQGKLVILLKQEQRPPMVKRNLKAVPGTQK